MSPRHCVVLFVASCLCGHAFGDAFPDAISVEGFFDCVSVADICSWNSFGSALYSNFKAEAPQEKDVWLRRRRTQPKKRTFKNNGFFRRQSKRQAVKQRIKARTGKDTKKLRRDYKLAQKKNPSLTQQSFLDSAAARRSRALKVIGHAGLLVVQARLMWWNMQVLNQQDEVTEQLSRRVNKFQKRYLHFDMNILVNDTDVLFNATYKLAQDPSRLEEAWQDLEELESDTWNAMAKMAKVQGWAAANGVISMGHAAVSLRELHHLYSKAQSFRDMLSLEGLVNGVSFASSVFTAYTSVDQFRTASRHVSELAVLHEWIQNTTKSLDKHDTAGERAEVGHCSTMFRSIPSGYNYMFHVVNVTAVSMMESQLKWISTVGNIFETMR